MYATLAQMVPHLLISLSSGVWADRYNRKHLIMLSDSFIAIATLGLALFYATGQSQSQPCSLFRSYGHSEVGYRPLP